MTTRSTSNGGGGGGTTAAIFDPREFMIQDGNSHDYDEDVLLAQAISASLETGRDSNTRHMDTKEEIRAKRLAAFDRRGK